MNVAYLYFIYLWCPSFSLVTLPPTHRHHCIMCHFSMASDGCCCCWYCVVDYATVVPSQIASPLHTNRCTRCCYCCYRHCCDSVDAETPAAFSVGIYIMPLAHMHLLHCMNAQFNWYHHHQVQRSGMPWFHCMNMLSCQCCPCAYNNLAFRMDDSSGHCLHPMIISLWFYAIIFDANRRRFDAAGSGNRANMHWIVSKDGDVRSRRRWKVWWALLMLWIWRRRCGDDNYCRVATV